MCTFRLFMLHNYITMHDGKKNIKLPKMGTCISVESPVLFCNTVIPIYTLWLSVSTQSCHLQTHEQDYYV